MLGQQTMFRQCRGVALSVSRRLFHLPRDRRGGVATVFAIAFPVLAVAATAAVELAEVQTAKSEMQDDVDAAAVKGARELQTDQSNATAERARIFADQLATPLRQRWTITSAASVDPAAGAVTVTQTGNRPSFFGSLLPPGGFQVATHATARVNSSTPLCVLALQSNAGAILNLTSRSGMQAANCLVQSNSDLFVNNGANLAAGRVQSVGAALGPATPAPLTDVPTIPDPFAALAINVPTRCDDFGVTIRGNTRDTLQPGVHCGPIVFVGSGTLTLAPGEHYFVDSQVVVAGNAQIVGSDVVVILKGLSLMKFLGNAGLSLEGRQSGPFSGFVLITDRSYAGTVYFSTTSARKLLGTIYLPNATLSVGGNGNRVADQSPWTVVVAHQILVGGSANLVINSSYFATAVPVPSGVGPSGSVAITN